jgi:hypothetical protein
LAIRKNSKKKKRRCRKKALRKLQDGIWGRKIPLVVSVEVPSAPVVVTSCSPSKPKTSSPPEAYRPACKRFKPDQKLKKIEKDLDGRDDDLDQFTPAEAQLNYRQQPCARCGRTGHATKHHFLPKFHFGTNGNHVVLCRLPKGGGGCHDLAEKVTEILERSSAIGQRLEKWQYAVLVAV